MLYINYINYNFFYIIYYNKKNKLYSKIFFFFGKLSNFVLLKNLNYKMSEIPLEEKQNFNPSIPKISSIKKDENIFNTKLYFDVPINSGSNISSPRLNNLNLSNSITSFHNYLPDDLINKIDNISPSTSPIEKNNILSSKVSDIETVSNKSDDSSIDDIQLIQYEDNIYPQPNNIQINNDNLVKNNNININININSNITPAINNQNYYNIGNNNQYNYFENYNNIYHNLSNQNLINFTNQQNLFSPNFQIINNNTFNSINNFNQGQNINNWMINNQIIQINQNISNNINNNMNINNNINNNKNNIKQKKKKSKKKSKPYDDYTLEMFGRRGWICEECNNFNYESRNKCNRCGIPKQPKKIIRNKINFENCEIIENIIKPEHKVDWCCFNCKNMNFSFRQICNRCQMQKIDSEKLTKNPIENIKLPSNL